MRSVAADRDRMIESVQPVVWFIVRRYFGSTPVHIATHDDLFQAGMLGVVKAARRWDGSRAKFSTYAALRARGEIIDYLRSLTGHRRASGSPPLPVSLDEVVSIESDGYKTTRADSLADPAAEEAYEIAAIAQLLRDALDKLPARDRAVIELRVMGGVRNTEICGALGVVESRISQIVRRGLERLAADESLQDLAA